MKRITQRIWKSKEYLYPDACGFIPKVDGFLHEDAQIRPCIVVVPGGSYRYISPVCGLPVAKKFFDHGYQVFVCSYTTNPFQRHALKDQPLQDLARAVRWIRKQAQTLRVDTSRLYTIGFSAGGHLVGSLAVHGNTLADPARRYESISCIPTGVIISYAPVSDDPANKETGTFVSLLGKNHTPEESRYYSLEKQVHTQMPPVFLWHTMTDQLVPVENSILFAKACKSKGVCVACHLFSGGFHGLALADETVSAAEENNFTLEQLQCIRHGIADGTVETSAEYMEWMDHVLAQQYYRSDLVWPEVAGWVSLALQWLDIL